MENTRNNLTQQEKEKILEDNQKIIISFCMKNPRYAQTYGSMDDFIQEMMMEVYYNFDKYDASRSKITTWMQNTASWKAKQDAYFKYRKQEKIIEYHDGINPREIPLSSLFLDDSIITMYENCEDINQEDIWDNMVRHENEKEENKFCDRLTQFIKKNCTQQFFDRYVEGMTLKSVSAQCNISHQGMDEKLKNELTCWKPFFVALQYADISQIDIKVFTIGQKYIFLEKHIFDKCDTQTQDLITLSGVDFEKKYNLTEYGARKLIKDFNWKTIDFRYVSKYKKYFK